ncbi:MAG: M56 family metallopeptidase [bacterium]
MTVAWTLYVLLVGALLTCAAMAVDDILRRTARPTRWVWVATLLAIVAFAAVAPRRPAPPAVQVSVATMQASPAAPTPAHGRFGEVAAWASRVITSAASTLIATANRRVPDAALAAFGLVWLGATVTLLVVLVGANRRVRQERRHWPLAEVGGAQVRLSPSLGPAVIGLAPPEIVVPRWLLERSVDEQRLVIVHEREHVAAHDQLLPVGGLVVAALLPWHPAVWFALARLRLAIELDCDARVLRRGVARRSYGALLIDIAGQCAGHRVGALALADRTSHLEKRLNAMKHTGSRFTFVRNSALGVVALLSVLVACEAKLPTSADVEAMDVATVQKAVGQAKLIDARDANVVYVVDGKPMSAEQAHAIPANQIATVNILKQTPATPADSSRMKTMVRIRTAAAAARGDSDMVMTMAAVEKFDSVSIEGQHMKVTTGRDAVILADHGKLTLDDGAPKSTTAFTGLVFVDGVQVPTSRLAALEPSAIESVEVVKGAAARKLSSDPAAANGIIRITTKK